MVWMSTVPDLFIPADLTSNTAGIHSRTAIDVPAVIVKSYERRQSLRSEVVAPDDSGTEQMVVQNIFHTFFFFCTFS